MHKTAFHWGNQDVILFKGWVLYTAKETFFSCLFFVMLGIIFQGIKFLRHQYGRRCRNTDCKRYILSKGHLLQTLMYILQFVWGYSLMLSVMTYNIWMLISVLSGFGLGYFLFGWGEYEDISAYHTLGRKAGQCGIECKTTCSTTTTQELLLNDEADISFKQDGDGTGIMKCNCDDSEL